ncbi:MAG: DNA (cytosine-5-)-methyltransferase [Pseudomonadota bacterium]
MREIHAIPLTGLTVASTFSGCGGSCLGFRWAGYRHVFASEFVAAARASHAANFPGVNLDGRDVREVMPADVLKGSGLKVGELDVLEGSPPCQAFSTAGKRHRGWGKDKDHGGGAKGNSEDLFFEFIRLLRGLRPRAFVAENVAGLVKGVAKGYFLNILSELRASGYAVECRILDAQWLGVPQARQRTIFIGVRGDLKRAPAFPSPLPYRYSIRDALPWIDGVEHGIGGHPNYSRGKFDVDADPSCTITTGDANKFVVRGPKMRFKTGWQDGKDVDLDEPSPTLMKGGIGGSAIGQFVVEAPATPKLPPDYLRRWNKLRPGEADPERFGLIRTDPDKPTPTVTVSPGASVTHPHEPRKFSIAELRRLGGFPDDFVLTGSFAEQWARVGNSVPPPMMFHVARVLRDEVLRRASRA